MSASSNEDRQPRRPDPERKRPFTVTMAILAVMLAAIPGCAGGRSSTTSANPLRARTKRTATTNAARSATTPRASATTAPLPRSTSTATPTTKAPASTGSPSTRRTPTRQAGNGLAVRRAGGSAWVVDIDTKVLRFNLMPGFIEPRGSFIRPPSITAAFRATVIAAFNGGFKFKDSRGGFFLGGVTPVPLIDGAASLVIYSDGTATVGQWNRDVRMSIRVEGVLQNLRLMVDRSARTDVSDSDAHRWGSTFPKETVARVPRSGVCVTADGRLRWVGSPSIGAATLADTMIQAGCIRGMELDINPKWVSFAVFDHPDPSNLNVIQDHNLYDGMRFSPETYFTGKDRNWVMLTRRPPL